MIRLAPIALLVCTACTPTTSADVPSSGSESGAQCDATAIQNLVGEVADQAAIDRAKAASGARDVRRYTTGSALTMDFRPDRLNVEVDTAGRIVKLSCG